MYLVSIIIPILNEEKNLPILINRLLESLVNYNYEIVFVNDGSTDNSASIINKLCKKYNNIKMITFSRNFGHQQAISAGLEYAEGDAVVIMDGDLQDPPEILPQFINKWQEGYEVVYAVRKNRKENIFKKAAYFCFYRFLNKISEIQMPLDCGDFSIIDRKIVNLLTSFPEKNKFIRGIRTWVGYNQIGIEYDRQSRGAGEAKYTFSKLVKLALDGIFSFSYKPIIVAINLGLFITIISFIGVIVTICLKLFWNYNLPGYASLMSVILFMGGVQVFITGIIGEYIGRIYCEVKNRPSYIVKEVVNVEKKEIRQYE